MVGPVQVGYNPTYEGATGGVLLSRMAEATFDDRWTGLTNVTAKVSTSALPTVPVTNTDLTILRFDNIQYRPNETCCK